MSEPLLLDIDNIDIDNIDTEQESTLNNNIKISNEEIVIGETEIEKIQEIDSLTYSSSSDSLSSESENNNHNNNTEIQTLTLNNQHLISEQPDLCIICYSESGKENFFDLDKNKRCVKKCNCKVIIHKSCFNQWYKRSETCPLCRKRIFYTTCVKECCLYTNLIISCVSKFFITLTIIYIFICFLFGLSRNSLN